LREARTLVFLLVVCGSGASQVDVDARGLVIETRVEFTLGKLTDEIVDLSALIAVERNGLNEREGRRLSRILDVARELFLGRALEHREKAFSRVGADSHESGAMRVVEG